MYVMRGGSSATRGFVTATWAAEELHTRYMCLAPPCRQTGGKSGHLDDCLVPPYSPEDCGVSGLYTCAFLAVLIGQVPMTSSRLPWGTRVSNCKSVSKLSCIELHRGDGPRKKLHEAIWLHLHVNDMRWTLCSVSENDIPVTISARAQL
jgi:hypothetical protein